MNEHRCSLNCSYVTDDLHYVKSIVFFSVGISSRTSLVLMLMVVPGQLIFLLTIYLLNQVKDFKITPTFAAIYLAAAVLQVGQLYKRPVTYAAGAVLVILGSVVSLLVC